MPYYPFGGKTYNLGTSISSTDTSITLSSFTEPVTGTPYTMLLLNTVIAFGTIAPKTSSSEFISFTGITQNADGTATLTGVLRGLEKKYPFTTNSSYKLPHAGQTQFIISDAPQVFAQYGALQNDEIISGQWEAPDPITAQGLVTNQYMLDLINGGTISVNSVIVAGTAGATISLGSLIYFDTATSQWKLTASGTSTTVQNVIIGVAQGSGTIGNSITGGVLVKGLDASHTGLTPGSIYYAGSIPGTINVVAGTFERAIGIARSSTTLYFDPDFYYIVQASQKAALVGTSGTPSASNPYATKATTDLKANIKFGGTGADGALTVSSGTTTINLATAQTVILNYTSISITGTGKIAFSNPNTSGTTVIIKSQGAITITSTAPCIDMSGIGAAAQNDGAGPTVIKTNKGADATAFNAPGAGGGVAVLSPASNTSSEITGKYPFVVPGAGGGGQGGTGSAGGGGGASVITVGTIGTNSANAGDSGHGAGGRGGGVLIIECAGALNFTTASGITVAGLVGAAGSGANGGGGGGGGGGICYIFYNTLTANSGTIVVSGGTGGAASGTGGTGGNGGAGYSLVAANTEFA